MTFRTGLVAAVIAALPTLVHGQDYMGFINQQLAQGQQQAWQAQQLQQKIVRQNMQNPAVQAAWRRPLASGGGLSLARVAYQSAATGGFTAQGMACYRQSEAANQAA